MTFVITLELVPPIEIEIGTEKNEKCLIVACGKSFGQETLKILKNNKEEFWFRNSISRSILQPFVDKYPECCI